MTSVFEPVQGTSLQASMHGVHGAYLLLRSIKLKKKKKVSNPTCVLDTLKKKS